MIGGLVARHTITVQRAPIVDDGRGNETADWSVATETASSGWAIDAGDTAEDLANRDGTSASYTLRGPWSSDVRGSDRVALFGEVFEVVGEVVRQPGPTEATSHLIVRLTRWEG